MKHTLSHLHYLTTTVMRTIKQEENKAHPPHNSLSLSSFVLLYPTIKIPLLKEIKKEKINIFQKKNKSKETKAESQRIVTTRLLNPLQYPVLYLSRLQRI